MTNIESKYKDILKKIRLFENGPASDLLKSYGLNYEIIFGLSIIDMKKIAKDILPDHEFAQFLRTKDIRETHILADLIDEPTKITLEKAVQIILKINNLEAAEQISYNLLVKLNFAPQLALELINSNHEYSVITGFLLVSRLKIISEPEDILYYIEKGKKLSNTENLIIAKSISRAFRNIAGFNSDFKKKVIEICEIIKRENNTFSDLIYEEVVPLI
jgi:3-methyladenine DNA glycosylase AlkD